MIKRNFLLILFATALLIFHISFAIADGNESITGKITQIPFSLAVQVVNTPVALELISPSNSTYWSKNDILLNYTTSSSAVYTWYTLDSGPNIFVTQPTDLSLSPGIHVLRLYSNNSDGNITTKNVTFSVNTTIFTIKYSSFKEHEKTTKIEKLTVSELNHVEKIVLEKGNMGSIKFNSEIDLLNISDTCNNTLDLESHILILPNKIYVNSTALPNFNKAATLTLDNLEFSDPYILRDGVPCTSAFCVIQSYQGGSLTFNVTGFSEYSATEGPAPSGSSSVPTSSSSGGGGGASSISKNIKVIPEEMLMSMKQGETRHSEILIQNLENKELEITLEVLGLGEFIFLSTEKLNIQSGQTIAVPFDMIIRENIPADFYIRQIIIKENGKEIERISIGIDVSSKKSLFDVKLSLVDESVRLQDTLLAEISIYNLGETGRVDSEIEYIIRDIHNKEVYSIHETQAIETTLNTLKRIKLPESLQEGEYILYVQTKYGGQIASASAWFTVVNGRNLDICAIILIGIFALLVLYFYIHKKTDKDIFEKMQSPTSYDQRKILNLYHKIASPFEHISVGTVEKSVERELIKLKQQMKQLDYAHSQKIVEDSEYARTKSEIERKIKLLKFRR